LAGKRSRPAWQYGRGRFAPGAFRVTVASFNTRTQRVVISLGFGQVARLEATTDGKPYDVFVRAG
jgi:ribosomal-protein-alanine N-acetyltransferase